MRNSIFAPAALVGLLALAGCYDKEADASLDRPADYSPNYHSMTRIAENGRTTRVLVPDACMAPPNHALGDDELDRLPPGCANAYNLQRMAERKKDLVKGRPLGPAPAEPSARAAKEYIAGTDKPTLGGAVGTTNGIERPTDTAEPQREK